MTYYCKICNKPIAASGRVAHLTESHPSDGPYRFPYDSEARFTRDAPAPVAPPHSASATAIAANYVRTVWKSDPDAIKACVHGLSEVDKYVLWHMYGTIAEQPIGMALVDWCRREVNSRSI